ncbi:MAG: signal recognition particle-docking protein FtsY [Gammaproteobacteria bacterium]|nr:signal recognition particle-docking protein FtsY [Gammaproteobacteria bacterium]MBL6999588.1 signal recognition particle-docking protein FtsY [Gammaproteobacteria bacterium]
MFSFIKNKTDGNIEKEPKPGIFSSLKNKLSKTRSSLTSGISSIFLGKKQIDEDLLEQLEDQLLMSDVGIEATRQITTSLTAALARKQLKDESSVFAALESAMNDILSVCNQPLVIDTQKKPFVILMSGINGAGKTTTIGKLAQQFKQQGLSVMLAAGDTFRAAAVEQLQSWGNRLDIPVISQGSGADSASVIFDALKSAQSRRIDVLIADTAGRLHTQNNLMAELEKITRVMKKLDPSAPHETMLVLDAGTGQNALAQAKSFHQTLQVSGITLTKLDGTAKGGIVFSLAQQMKLPIRYIGVGETAQDLRVFDAKEFIKALLDRD